MYAFDFIKFMNKTLFYGINFHLMRAIYYFNRKTIIKISKILQI